MSDISNVCIGHVEAIQNSCFNCVPDSKNESCSVFYPIGRYDLPDYIRVAYEGAVAEKIKLQEEARQRLDKKYGRR